MIRSTLLALCALVGAFCLGFAFETGVLAGHALARSVGLWGLQ